MKNFKFLIAFFVSILYLASCTSSQYTYLDRSDKKSPQIDVYMIDQQQPNQEYDVLAYIETSGWVFTNKKQLLRGLRNKAKNLEADAIIDVRFFYIPHLVSGLPTVEGIAVKYNGNH